MIPDWWCNPSPLNSDILSPELIRSESVLSGCILNKLFGFKRFSRPFRVSFHLLLTLLFRYRSWGIFRFTSVYLVHSYEKTIPHYSGTLAAAFQITVTRLSRSMARLSRSIHLLWVGRTRSSHHISFKLSLKDSVWSIPLSLAVTHGITIVFFSSWY
jgi:hypothetical protein